MSKNVTEFCSQTYPLIERFWKKVDIRGAEECWFWTAGKFKDGYGAFAYAGHQPGRAHRFSYLLHYGEIPEGTMVLHTCDNHACVNPTHLWLGTARDNAQDAVSKGRWMSPARTAWLKELAQLNTKPEPVLKASIPNWMSKYE